MSLPFPPLHFPLIFFPPSVRPWGDASVHQVFRPTLAVGRTYSFCGVQCVHSCADPLPHAEGGRPRQPPSAIKSTRQNSGPFCRLHPPPPSFFPLFSSCSLANTPTCYQPGQQPAAWRHFKLSSQSTPKEIFHPGAGVEFYPAMPHCTPHCIALHNAVEPFRVGGGIPPHIEVGSKVAF